MAEWRFGRSWSEGELQSRLEHLRGLGRNFPGDPERSDEGADPRNPWQRYYSEAVIAQERPGPPEPGGAFARARSLVERYEFSDPGIVKGHFVPQERLLGRPMLLEIRVAGLHYLCGVRVGAVRDERPVGDACYGYRYETLEGHIEQGAEWFLLTQRAETGEVWFRIQAAWRRGELPNWWSRAGFEAVGARYQRAWHRLSYHRLRALLGSGKGLKPLPAGRALFHSGPEIVIGAQVPAALARAGIVAHGDIREGETGR